MDSPAIFDKKEVRDSALQKAQRSQEILKVLKAGVFKNLAFARRHTTGALRESRVLPLLGMSKDDIEKEEKRTKERHEKRLIERSAVLKIHPSDLVRNKSGKKYRGRDDRLNRERQSVGHRKPSTAQENTRRDLVLEGFSNPDPMGDRKREDDAALAIRNMSMRSTLRKSREYERI